MGLPEEESTRRFADFAAGLADTIGNRVRCRHLKEYCTGLLLPGERKSVEPIAAKIAPVRLIDKMQQALMRCAGFVRSDLGRNRFDTLALARQQQSRAILLEMTPPNPVADRIPK